MTISVKGWRLFSGNKTAINTTVNSNHLFAGLIISCILRLMKKRIKNKVVLKRIFTKAFLIGALLLVAFPSLVVGSYRGVNYLQAKRLLEESNNLVFIEKYGEATEKLAIAEAKWVPIRLKSEIEISLKLARGLEENENNFKKGSEYYDEKMWPEAKKYLLLIPNVSRYFEEAQIKLKKVEQNTLKITASTKSEIKNNTALVSPTPKSIPTPIPATAKFTFQLPTPTQKSGEQLYDEWAATQPKDSFGNICSAGPAVSHCKYECSVVDFWVDDHLSILNNHLQEYKLRLDIYGPESSNAKIWEDAVMNVYNMIYDECINSPIFHPSDPI